MEIPNYEKKETTNNFKQLYDYMPDRCFRMLICGKSGCNLEQEKYTHLSEIL